MTDEHREYVVIELRALRELLSERDRRYEQRFLDQERAVVAALAAQKELTASAFAASEKAIVKAENAQQEYNVRSNEFRGQLDDQAKTLMPRRETEQLMAAVNDNVERLRMDVIAIRDDVNRRLGGDARAQIGTARLHWTVGTVIAAVAVGVSLVGFLMLVIEKF